MCSVDFSAMEITATQLQELNTTTPLAPRVTIAALIGIAVVATIIFPGSLWGLALVSATLIGSMVLWWQFLRGQGQRLNNYDPLKTDAEVQRSAIDWKEEGRLLVLFIVAFGLINVGSVMKISPILAIPIGLICFAVALWSITKKPFLPPHYIDSQKLYRQHPGYTVQRDADGIVACMHALQIVPGARQMHNTEFLKVLEKELHWPQSEAAPALEKAIGSGRVVSIRELRLRDDAITWITLSPKSLAAFQKSVTEG
ncbi:hypothetical protein CUROG_03040 [Corynebacterium urogenitale]|uniref:Uncharacterized protein n=2 Tax=Corynebacterium urogenitale TaxID=2487892 RepID=A0A5J6Z6J0_9CORY|nr:hypothetical protein CUROG_03040 [Corynebacterium urogenitale]